MRWLVPVLTLALTFGDAPLASDAFSYDPTKIDPTLLSQILANPNADFNVIVRSTTEPKAKEGRAQRAGNALKKNGGKPRHQLAIVGGASGTVKGVHIFKLSRDNDVDYIDANARLTSSFDPVAGSALAGSAGVLEIDAPRVWSELGYTGRGVGVAVIDSGVYGHLDLAGRIVAAVDFTNGPATVSTGPLGDQGGHGTHVAGLVAGDGASSGGTYTGVAPNANIIDVRVIDGNGNSNIAIILRAMMWVLQNRSTYNIRVVNMSLGAEPAKSYKTDLLASAAEVLYFAGVTIVAAAGNTGPGEATITSPAFDPYVIAVGAVDDAGTPDKNDDQMASFSSRGPTKFDYLSKPNVVAPGRRLVSLRAPGSTLDTRYPERQVTADGQSSSDYFRLSGTSMAAPVVSGIAALLYEEDPRLDSRTVRTRILSTATPLLGYSWYDQGRGMVNAYAAATSTLAAWRGRRRPTDFFARDMYQLLLGQPLGWFDLFYNGGVDSRGRLWSNITWENITWDNITWENITWENFTWENITWEGFSSENITWETTSELSAGALSGTGSGWSPVE